MAREFAENASSPDLDGMGSMGDHVADLLRREGLQLTQLGTFPLEPCRAQAFPSESVEATAELPRGEVVPR